MASESEADEFAASERENVGSSSDDDNSSGSEDGSSSSSSSSDSTSSSSSSSGPGSASDRDDSDETSSRSSSSHGDGTRARQEEHEQEQEQKQPGRRRRRKHTGRKVSQREDRFLKGPNSGRERKRKRKRTEGGGDEATAAEEEMQEPDWGRYTPAFADGKKRRRAKKAAERRAGLAGWAFGHFCLNFRNEYGARILWLPPVCKRGGAKVRRCLTPLELEAQVATEWRNMDEAEQEKYFKRAARYGRPTLLPPPKAPRPAPHPEREDPTAGLYTLEELWPGAPHKPPRNVLSLVMRRHGLQLRQAQRRLGEMPAWERETLEQEVTMAKAEYPARVRAYCRGGGTVPMAPVGAAASAASAAVLKGRGGGGKGKAKAPRTKAKT